MELKCREVTKVNKKQIKQAMREKNIFSISQLSRMTKIDRATLTKWINGKEILGDKSWQRVKKTLLTW